MRVRGPARHPPRHVSPPKKRGILSCLLLALALAPRGLAAAQERPRGEPAGMLVLGDAAELGELLSSRGPLVAAYPEARLSRDLDALLAERSGSVSREALSPLSEVDALLSQARASLAELDERGALLCLARACRLAEQALAVPGAVSFYAEAQLQLGIAAAQAGLPALAEQALSRAALLAPRRKLLAGEASPEVVARAAQLWSDAGNAPIGEVPIEVDAERARVFLDDVEVGVAPVLVRASEGEHVLRVEAPGRVAYGARFFLPQGRRPAQRVVLAPDPLASALATLQHSTRAGLTDGALEALTHGSQALLAQAPSLSRVLIVFGAGPRALMLSCGRGGCEQPRRLEHGRWVAPPPWQPNAASAAGVAEARAWLEPAAGPRSLAVSSVDAVDEGPRWYLWGGLAVLAVGAAALVTALAMPEPEQKLRVVIEPPGAD